jgi:hypothetical protein
MFDPIGHLSYEGRLKIHPPAMQKKSTCQLVRRSRSIRHSFTRRRVGEGGSAPGRRSFSKGGFLNLRAANASQRTLRFEERVVYQRAIEEVYWRHRIWPKENANPKPTLDAVMSQAQLRWIEWRSTPSSQKCCANSLTPSGTILL